MARKVIKAFLNKDEGGKLYAPASLRSNVYEGDREDELFEKGFLGDEVVAVSVGHSSMTVTDTEINIKGDSVEITGAETAEEVETEDLKELTNAQLEERLKAKGIEYPKRAVKDDLIKLLTEE